MARRRPKLPPLPRNWPASVKSAVIHVISLAQYSLAQARGWAADSRNGRVRLKAKLDRANQEIALLREEMRIKDARMKHLPPHQRPHYPPIERMAILELKSARNWSLAQTARAFLVTSATISYWMRRLDEEGPDALVQMQQPVNRFPDYITYMVQRLKRLSPTVGKRKIAQILARAGLHLGTTTVGRMLKQKPKYVPTPTDDSERNQTKRIVTAKRPNHIWHTDLTIVPTSLGFWVSWMPLSLLQTWPFCHWLAIVVDHHSRRAMGFAVFNGPPTSEQIRAFLGRTITKAGVPPKYLICDKGPQFWCRGFKVWCKRRNITQRFGAVGRHGSVAVIERLILSIKLILRFLPMIPLQADAFRRDVNAVLEWYNGWRPHTTLRGCTPDEVYDKHFPANRRPRYEVRHRWPHRASCARPWALVRGSPGAMVELDVRLHHGHRQLPIVALRRAS